MSPADVEIRWVPKDDIYDLFVRGQFRNFFQTFGEAAIAADRIIHADVIQQWHEQPKKKGKVRA